MRPVLNKAWEDDMRRRIEEVRKTVKVEDIVKELHACVDGSKILSKEQLRAAEILLKKAMPDMKEIEHTGSVTHEAGDSIQDLLKAIDGRSRSLPG